MLDKATASKLRELKLSHMAKAFSTYFSDQSVDGLSFEERFSILSKEDQGSLRGRTTAKALLL